MEKNPHAVALGKLGGRKGGRANTPAQLAARQHNAKLGGRPKKIKPIT
jgi:hypothetical protein